MIFYVVALTNAAQGGGSQSIQVNVRCAQKFCFGRKFMHELRMKFEVPLTASINVRLGTLRLKRTAVEGPARWRRRSVRNRICGQCIYLGARKVFDQHFRP